MIPTDMRLFGFPVFYDWRVDRKVIELHNPNGDVIRIEFYELPDAGHAVDPHVADPGTLTTREK